MARRKPVSAATKAKISAALVGNKNAFQGGPREKLTKRTQVSNINARTKAKAAAGLLTPEQLSRRQAVAKRLRSQARREEALGKGPSGAIPQMGSTPSGTSPNPRRIKTLSDEKARRSTASATSQRATRAKNTGVHVDRTGHPLVGGLPDRTSPRSDSTGLAGGGPDRSKKPAIQNSQPGDARAIGIRPGSAGVVADILDILSLGSGVRINPSRKRRRSN
jgi:hypothetical protein